MRAGRREDPAERRGRGLPRADAAGGLLHGEVGAARGHPGGGGGGSGSAASGGRRLERDGIGKGSVVCCGGVSVTDLASTVLESCVDPEVSPLWMGVGHVYSVRL